MDRLKIQQLSDQEKSYWWHVSRRAILQSVLESFFICHSGLAYHVVAFRRSRDPESRNKNEQKHSSSSSCLGSRLRENDNRLKILDIGCGAGANLQWLDKFGDVIGIDSNEEAVRLCNRHNIAIQGEADSLPSQIHDISLVTAFDVLEHIENDNKALREWNRVLRPDGKLLITVPAYQWLYGPHDKNLSHYRRYYLGDLILKIENNGFKVIQSSYFFFLTLPMLIISRFIDKILNRPSGYSKLPVWLNKFLIFLTSLEAKPIVKGWQSPFGSSIIIYARKQN